MISHAHITAKALEVFGDNNPELHTSFINGGIFVLESLQQENARLSEALSKKMDLTGAVEFSDWLLNHGAINNGFGKWRVGNEVPNPNMQSNSKELYQLFLINKNY